MSKQALKQAATGQRSSTNIAFPAMVEQYKNQIQRALPQHMNAERMARIAMTCYRQSDKLQQCAPESLFACVIQSAQLGLEPGVNGEAYLVPFWNSRRNPPGFEAQFIPGYRGLIKLARNTAEVSNVSANIVYENDKADLVFGTDESLVHNPFMGGNRGRPMWVYCVAHFKDGSHHIEAMTWDEVMKIKDRSKSRNRDGQLVGPWTTDEEEMARKTVVRRASKYWPMSIELSTAISLDTAAAMGIPQELDTQRILDGEAYQVPDDEDDTPVKDAPIEVPDEKPEAEADAPAGDEAAAKEVDTEPADPKQYSVDYLTELVSDAKSMTDIEYVIQLNEKHQAGNNENLQKVRRAIGVKKRELEKKK